MSLKRDHENGSMVDIDTYTYRYIDKYPVPTFEVHNQEGWEYTLITDHFNKITETMRLFQIS